MEDAQDMHLQATTYIAVIFKNLLYLSALGFTYAVNRLIVIFPTWKESLEDFKIIGGAVIIILVITKLILEIKKLKQKP